MVSFTNFRGRSNPFLERLFRTQRGRCREIDLPNTVSMSKMGGGRMLGGVDLLLGEGERDILGQVRLVTAGAAGGGWGWPSFV
jgi:hypothetical protein